MEDKNNKNGFDLIDHGADNNVNQHDFINISGDGKTTESTQTQMSPNEIAVDSGLGRTANEIEVSINDQNAPIIVLFGEPGCGKTMTLIRLTRWLTFVNQQFFVTPDKNFRNGDDDDYEKICKRFFDSIDPDNNKIAPRTSNIDFMLLEVREKKSRTKICQLLEAPGEHFVGNEYPCYIQAVRNSNAPKTWVFYVDVLNPQNKDARKQYIENIIALRNGAIGEDDRVIFVCDKADLAEGALFRRGYPVEEEFFKKVYDNYRSNQGPLLDNFKNETPILKWFKPFDFDFVVFSAGSFTKDGHYVNSKDFYPETLWRAILKTVR